MSVPRYPPGQVLGHGMPHGSPVASGAQPPSLPGSGAPAQGTPGQTLSSPSQGVYPTPSTQASPSQAIPNAQGAPSGLGAPAGQTAPPPSLGSTGTAPPSSLHPAHAHAQTLSSRQQAMPARPTGTHAMATVSVAAPMPPPPQGSLLQYPQTGAVLVSPRGTYAVSNVIGSGEFGAVYECIGPFDQVYALKMVRPANRPYHDVQAEWLKEVQRLLSLRHPNVVYIYDAFEQGHLFYLALERCEHPLSAMLGHPMQEGLVLELGRQLLAAVQFLHDNDVVHDDLHPGNVLISHDVDRPIVKIGDFGISHELRGQPGVRPNVVHHAIMAPEILATGYTSKQSDLYQIGLLLYWMLTGAPAVDIHVPYAELVRQVSEGEPRRRAEALGTPLGLLIAKMLRRREAYRYTSAREVWSELRTLPTWQKRALFPVR